MTHYKYLLLFASGLIISTSVWANKDNGFALVNPCMTCHGPNGSSVGLAMPSIAGFKSENFIEIMEEYQNDERPSTIMGRIAKGYEMEEFEIMANYFAKQPFLHSPQKVDAKKAKKGQKLHKKYCEKCHERNGTLDQAGTGILAGQWMLYLQFSLTDFMTGNRDMPKNKKKRFQKMLHRYGEESLENLVHFYGSRSGRHANP